VAQLYPRALGSFYVTSYDSQGYGGSKSRYDRRPVNLYVLLPSPLGIKGVPSERISIRHQEGYIKNEIPLYHHSEATCEACSATWNLCTNSEFDLGPSRGYFATDGQLVSQYMLVSSTLVALATRYYSRKTTDPYVVLGRPSNRLVH
jgi:hypothetical protein